MRLLVGPKRLLHPKVNLPSVRHPEPRATPSSEGGRLLKLHQAEQPAEVSPRFLLPATGHRGLYVIQTIQHSLGSSPVT